MNTTQESQLIQFHINMINDMEMKSQLGIKRQGDEFHSNRETTTLDLTHNNNYANATTSANPNNTKGQAMNTPIKNSPFSINYILSEQQHTKTNSTRRASIDNQHQQSRPSINLNNHNHQTQQPQLRSHSQPRAMNNQQQLLMGLRMQQQAPMHQQPPPSAHDNQQTILNSEDIVDFQHRQDDLLRVLGFLQHQLQNQYQCENPTIRQLQENLSRMQMQHQLIQQQQRMNQLIREASTINNNQPTPPQPSTQTTLDSLAQLVMMPRNDDQQQPPNTNININPNDKNQSGLVDNSNKPSHSYIGLIGMAILSTPQKMMVLNDIYNYIMTNYPQYKDRLPGWRNSIRHNLSLNECFQKSDRAPNGKGHYWTIHPANMEDFMNGDFRRKRAQRKVRMAHNMELTPEDLADEQREREGTIPALPEHFKRSLEMHRQIEEAAKNNFMWASKVAAEFHQLSQQQHHHHHQTHQIHNQHHNIHLTNLINNSNNTYLSDDGQSCEEDGI